ncbi:MAG: succinylglutamate desuccinylase, partial [Gammaproteobacteria bacterium]|nr:succinylglutamate desuccinylase [Gammaproteobacteria bacterium]
LVAECGQHFLKATADVATAVTLDFLGHFGLIERKITPPGPQRRFELVETRMVKTPEFAFTRPLLGFETFAEGELIATDGADEIRSPCDQCTVLMPTRQPIVGREAVYLARPLAD